MKDITKDDMVKLKTGGPEMTVISSSEDNYIQCAWVNRLNAEMRGSFPRHTLDIHKKD